MGNGLIKADDGTFKRTYRYLSSSTEYENQKENDVLEDPVRLEEQCDIDTWFKESFVPILNDYNNRRIRSIKLSETLHEPEYLFMMENKDGVQKWCDINKIGVTFASNCIFLSWI